MKYFSNSKFITILLVIHCSIISYINSWWNEGHMIVANIAKMDLLERNPDAYYFMNNLTEILEPERHGKIKSFVESATWPDLIKGYKLSMMDAWHFRDIPVNYSDPSTTPYIDHNLENNALFFIEKGYKNLMTWTQEEASDIKNQFEKSFILTFMVHIIGDVHQPLHSCALFSEVFPKGDQGGNFFHVTDGNPQVKNLHSAWDSIFSKVVNDLALPLNSTSQELINKYTSDTMQEYSREKLKNELDDDFYFHDWLKESWKLCKDFVYKDLEMNKALSEAYMNEGYDLAKHRIALAGYRLSNMIISSYDEYLKVKETIRQEEGAKMMNLNKKFLSNQ